MSNNGSIYYASDVSDQPILQLQLFLSKYPLGTNHPQLFYYQLLLVIISSPGDPLNPIPSTYSTTLLNAEDGVNL